LPRQAPAEVGERETSKVGCGVLCHETWGPSASEIVRFETDGHTGWNS
jgi:hypothetical protein